MNRRARLNAIYSSRDQLDELIDIEMEYYLAEEHENYLYISDHAIDRYKERILKMRNDEYVPPETIRMRMLTKEQQRFILKNKIHVFKTDEAEYVIKGLTVVTTRTRTR